MLSIVLPVTNLHEMTDDCISHLNDYAKDPVEVIVVDNGSTEPFQSTKPNVHVIRNEKNIGFWPAMVQGISYAHSPYVLCMHNDVFVWENGFDQRIVHAFERDVKIGAVGFFGGRGVCRIGGRGHPEGNMLGKEHGTPQAMHGYVLTEEHPAVVFDSLAIAVRTSALPSFAWKDLPPHHWTDRLLCLNLMYAGYRCLTVGIAFDHAGASTSRTSVMNTFTKDWCEERHILPVEGNYETALYKYGEAQFQALFDQFVPSPFRQVWVTEDWKYHYVT